MAQHDVGWMMSDSRVVASVNIARTRRARGRGMKAFADASVPLVIERCGWVHSLGMRFAVDVAYLDVDDSIVAIGHLKPNRLALPVRRAVRVVEATPGAFERWGLAVGDTLAIRDTESAPRP
jgi:hypothetical protein